MKKHVMGLVDRQLGQSRALQRAALNTTGLGEPPPEPGPVITISRQLGSGSRQVAQRLVERLGWSLWDKDLVDAIAKDADVDRWIVETFDEKTISEIDVLARTLTGQYEFGGFMYGQHLAKVLLAVARHGYAIILGRGANFLLTGALNIRLVASEEVRITNLMDYGELSREEALDRIRQTDKERADFIRKVYLKDIEDPLAYDVVITVDNFGIEGAVEIILTAYQAKYEKKEKKEE
ncbi:MAG TPA: cytidylate kinase-like family protein [Armatimonadota bacterium]|nr:cytidylate kinase-like family protein [Armatimonadota bacterium]HOM71963.1 cytidylate kinase-like family protein [Armatimonadota bacterium]HPP74517.1 cytidylate kinase-like family protein [Armatimonadota bacterium]